MKIRSVRLIFSALAAMLVLSACADSADETPTTIPDDDHTEFAFGEPASPEDADRTIEVSATDDLRFDPDSVTVAEGETVLFRIVNQGQLPHDFTLGDEAAQQVHEEEMAEMGGMEMPDEPNAVVLAAGETKELAWTFTQGGTVLFGCHQPGHYDAGMKGEVTVGG
jgi:uncharacterized cupredoxin-like copper-binding protein